MPGAPRATRRRRGWPGPKLAREDLGRLGTDDEIWQAEIKASAAHWSGQRAGAIVGPDAQFDAIMAELSEIKRMLRKLLHG